MNVVESGKYPTNADTMGMKELYDNDEAYFRLLSEWLVSGRYNKRLDLLMSCIKPYWSETARILDAGCGAGGMAITLARSGAGHIDAVDFSTTALVAAGKNARRYGVSERINFIEASLEDMQEIENNAYDLILAADVIEHLPDHSLFINEMMRICRSGGHLVVETPNTTFRTHPLYQRLEKVFSGLGLPSGEKLMKEDVSMFDHYHIGLLAWEDLVYLLKTCGWEIIEEKPFGWWWKPGAADRVMGLYARFGSLFKPELRYHQSTDVLVVARKPVDLP